MAAEFTYTAENAERELGVLNEIAELGSDFHFAKVFQCPDRIETLKMAANHPIGLKLLGREFIRRMECQYIICLFDYTWKVRIPFDKLALFRPNGWKSYVNTFK